LTGFKASRGNFATNRREEGRTSGEVNSKHIQLTMIGRMCFSQMRFILDGVVRDNYILNGGLVLEMNHNTFNIRKNLVIETESGIIVGHM
jgi:hypothetical protein